jgi:hypothetical protein
MVRTDYAGGDYPQNCMKIPIATYGEFVKVDESWSTIEVDLKWKVMGVTI